MRLAGWRSPFGVAAEAARACFDAETTVHPQPCLRVQPPRRSCALCCSRSTNGGVKLTGDTNSANVVPKAAVSGTVGSSTGITAALWPIDAVLIPSAR